MDAQAKPAAERRQAELVATARRSSFGQDTSQLYERDDGKKPWRAEYPATVEEKQAGSQARERLLAAFPLNGLCEGVCGFEI